MNVTEIITDISRGVNREELAVLCVKIAKAEPLDDEERQLLAAVMLALFPWRNSMNSSGNVDYAMKDAIGEVLKDALSLVVRHPTE